MSEHPFPKHVVELIKDKLAEEHGELLSCTRVWSSWSYNTMSEDDFVPIHEDQDVLSDLANTALQVLWNADIPTTLSAADARQIWSHAVSGHQGSTESMHGLRTILSAHSPDWIANNA